MVRFHKWMLNSRSPLIRVVLPLKLKPESDGKNLH